LKLYFVGKTFFRSLLYERAVLSHLDKVQGLPPNVQADIATRVANYITIARKSGDDDLERFAAAAIQERNRAIAEGAKSETDLRRASPELAAAWCKAMLGLGDGNLDRHSAIGIITAIESFASKRASVAA
jgi:hypothetical protein